MTPFRTLVTLLAVTAALAAAATGPSTAATTPPLTGIWAGTLKQDLGLEQPYTTKLVVTALRGRVRSVVARVRMECDGATRDAVVVKSWPLGTGPKLTQAGAFTLRTGGVVVSGSLGRIVAGGTAAAVVDGCSGRGTWSARRRSI